MKHPDGSMEQFHNRVRVMLSGLDDSAYPKGLREFNPFSAKLWKKGGLGRMTAFLHAPEQVAQCIWQAVLDYEASND